ncbi:upf0488 protein c8orf33 homolog [Plakobranchus ocellatus]|uniref:Upf0488 protein c8orf33 homolog n=1 Tax=Plakobranchus ocellatus TaxID=259542 RepID=A0AAV4BBQ8_9GAST|nr:upf0488 protein c8orf33 homolog [Plakobranchus ocellatus]
MASLPEEKFHDELRWCITQLELGLAHQDADSRQAAETVKILKILRSSKAPLVKKRQAMRNALGDYRKKMRESEKKFVSGLRNSKFQPVGNMKAYSKSKFLRQSNSRTSDKDELGSHLSSLLLEQKVPEGSQCPDESHDDDDKNVNCLSGSVNLLQDDHKKDISEYSQNLNSNCSVGFLSELSSASGPGSVVAHESAMKRQKCIALSHNNADKGSEEMFGSSTSTGFHFAPSDNSFCFGFTEEEENVGKETTGAKDGVNDAGSSNSNGYKQSGQTENSYHPEGEKVKSNIFKYERTDNSFVFNFSLDGDGLS